MVSFKDASHDPSLGAVLRSIMCRKTFTTEAWTEAIQKRKEYPDQVATLGQLLVNSTVDALMFFLPLDFGNSSRMPP